MKITSKIAKSLLKSEKGVKVKNKLNRVISLRVANYNYVIGPRATITLSQMEVTPEIKRLLADDIIEIK